VQTIITKHATQIKWIPIGQYRYYNNNDAPWGLSNGTRVKNQLIFGFVMECKLKVNSLTLTKKEGTGIFKIGLGWIHKQEFKMKLIL